eukprot:TRINITY_DN3719_c0_g1_i1.p1 TRINITY_DN3719_c0_g1~~TRINITY_DN3719_c0_g1_i1.p1  ORF type:complete len:131 (+),score=36.32 TRINITY_DN3719_c0_g1_i1:130-522(+)
MLPFTNTLASVKITGKVLKSVMEQSVLYEGLGGFLQISGFSFNYSSSRPAGSKVLYMLHPNGSVIKDDDQMTLALTDYLISGGDGYIMFPTLPVIIPDDEGDLLTSILIEAVGSQKQISPKIEGRIVKTP